MVGKEARLKAVADVSNNLLNSLNETGREDNENTTPSATPEGEISPLPHGDLTILCERGTSTSTAEEAPPAVKRLLEEWLMSALKNMLEKPTQGDVEDVPPIDITDVVDEPSATRTSNTRTVTNAGDGALMDILKKMKEMKNENKTLRIQMKEHQEGVNNTPGAPKLLPKRDVGRFVEQPYNKGAAPHHIPKTFKMSPCLKIYDGTTDPEDHLIHYVTAVKGGALTWYSQLPARSISTFEEMVDKFATAHVGAKKAEARVNDSFVVRQTTGERLRDFLAQFNRVRMSLPNVSEGMAVAAFQNGLNRNRSKETKKLLSRLIKYPSTTWEEIHNAYYAEVRADEDDMNGLLQRLTSVQNKTRRDRLYALEKLGTKVQGPQKMKSDPSTRRSNVLCEFHQERGHKTEDCIGLRQEVVRMLNQGYLKELLSDKGRANFTRGRDSSQGPPKTPEPPLPACTIQMITGGGDDTAINHVKFTTTDKLKRTVAHDQIMVDDGSGACIVHPRVLVQMRLEDKIIPRFITLTGFNNAVERTSGEIVLPDLVGGVTLETTFHVINQETAYNAIIGRPWIHAMRAIPSSFYQVIKFPNPWGIFSIRGEPCTAEECYRITQDCTHTKQLKGASAEA
uniref:Retrotransposon gag domain-containing protein n=1 Tax=Nicotiana tabacum TaxID=4097 RepID=A0A1S4C8T8_TOBAC|nr:PREDICTED: uncharacterized protein LOC107816196 [Nicotiana tabacum]